MNTVFSRRSVSGARTCPSSIVLPEPFAHHSLEWNPFPEKRTASRTGAWLPGFAAVVTSPQTGSDSIHGRAIVTPTPRRKVRRVKWCVFIKAAGGGTDGLAWDKITDFDASLTSQLRVPAANLPKLRALDDRFDCDGEAVAVLLELLLDLIEERLVGELDAAA